MNQLTITPSGWRRGGANSDAKVRTQMAVAVEPDLDQFT